MARGAPEHLADVMTYLRAPQRPDWFMDALADVAAETKDAASRARIYDAIASMPVPAQSNKHHKTYVRCVEEAAAASRAAGDAENAARLEKKAAMFTKKKR
jgi:C4-dicarboxylate-specific signal transduction histidine kinase